MPILMTRADEMIFGATVLLTLIVVSAYAAYQNGWFSPIWRFIRGTAALLWFPVRAVIALCIIILTFFPLALIGHTPNSIDPIWRVMWRWDLCLWEFICSFYVEPETEPEVRNGVYKK